MSKQLMVLIVMRGNIAAEEEAYKARLCIMLLLFWYRKKDPKARDASIKEQMAVVVRYVTSFTLHFVVFSSLLILFSLLHFDVGMFLGVQHVPDTTSSSLKQDMVYLFQEGQFHGLQRLRHHDKISIGEDSRFITMNMNDMRENGWDPLFEELIELSKIYDADFSDYERTCLMDQLLLFIDETHMFHSLAGIHFLIPFVRTFFWVLLLIIHLSVFVNHFFHRRFQLIWHMVYHMVLPFCLIPANETAYSKHLMIRLCIYLNHNMMSTMIRPQFWCQSIIDGIAQDVLIVWKVPSIEGMAEHVEFLIITFCCIQQANMT
ncbi:hypothetical protein ACJX0J_034851, partial [Zea mays]